MLFIFAAVVVVTVAALILLVPKWLDRWEAAGRRKIKTQTISNFQKHKPQFDALIRAWRITDTSIDACGLPAQGPSFGQFRAFAIKGDGRYRVGVRDEDKLVPDIQEASKMIGG